MTTLNMYLSLNHNCLIIPPKELGIYIEVFIEILFTFSGRWWGAKDTVPIVALHGLLDNAATFDTLAPLLNVPSLLSLDLPGHGMSSHLAPGTVFHYYDHFTCLRYVLNNHFNWKDLTLLGHSYGGSLAFMYSTIYPNDVKECISIDGATYTIAPKEPKTFKLIRSIFDRHMIFEEKLKNSPPEGTLDELVQLMYNSRKKVMSVNEEACRILVTRGSIQAPSGKYYFSRDLRLNSKGLGAATIKFVNALSEQIKCDVLYIRSTSSIIIGDWLAAYENSLGIMRKKSKRVEDHVVEGGHHVHLENPERVAPIINSFLNS